MSSHEIQHCLESEHERNVWVLSLIPKEEESLKVTPETIATALEKLNKSVDKLSRVPGTSDVTLMIMIMISKEASQPVDLDISMNYSERGEGNRF